MATSRVVIPVLENLEQNDKPLVKQVVKGIKQIQEQQINSQSTGSTQTTFSFQPPSQNTVIDRCFELEIKGELTAGANAFSVQNNNASSSDTIGTGAVSGASNNMNFKRFRTRIPCVSTSLAVPAIAAVGAGDAAPAVPAVAATFLTQGNFLGNSFSAGVGNNIAPKQFPLASCMDSIDLVLNGTHFSVSVGDYIKAVMTYTTPEWRNINLQQTSHAPDVLPDGFSRVDERDTGTGFNGNHQDSLYNPLNLLQDGFRRGEEPRGAYWSRDASSRTIGANGGDANAKLSFTLREPLFISPLMCMLGHGLTNINQIDITIRWKADLANHLWEAHSANASFNNAGNFNAGALTANFLTTTDSARLHVRYYTAMDDVNIPNEIVLPYKQPQLERQTVAAGAQTVSTNNIRLNQVPECCFVYVASDLSGANYTYNNNYTYARLKGINIRWKNQTGILSGLTESDLIQLSSYNGLDRTLSEAIAGGYVLKLNFGQDIPLDDNESPGTRGDYTWQIGSLQYDTSTCDVNAGFTLYQVFVLNGHAIVSPNECRVSTGVLSLEENMRSSDMGHSYQAPSAEVAGGSMISGGSEVGGSLIGGVAGHLKKVMAVGKHLGKAVAAAAPEVKEAVQAYKSRA